MPEGTDRKHYAIRGGVEGRNRLRVLASVMNPTTCAFLDRLDLQTVEVCIDAGCGGGDVSRELARRIHGDGKVIGIDLDETKIKLATEETTDCGLTNIEFRTLDIRNQKEPLHADFVFSRFLVTHLPEPAAIIQSFFRHLRPGGIVALEDIDFSAHLVYPGTRASRRYQQLYRDVVRRKGGDADIGPKLPLLLKNAGFVDISINVIQPMALHGDVKLLNPLTMEAIADAVVEEGLATLDETATVAAELYAIAADPEVLAGVPRIFQVSARRPV